MENATSRVFALGAIVAVAGAAVGIGSVITASLFVYSIGGTPDGRPTTFTERPASRLLQSTYGNDSGTVKREQDRRNARLRDNVLEAQEMEDELFHSAAPETDEELKRDPRLYGRAYRFCTFQGFTRARHVACLDSILQTGEYERGF